MKTRISVIPLLLVSIFTQIVVFAGPVEAANDPQTRNERSVLLAMRTLHGAESTYFSTHGNNNYGTLAQLGATQLIDQALATGYKYGYKFVVTIRFSTPTTPAEFAITATPRKYRLYGRLSVYIGTDGVMRGGDNGGQPATADDPVIDEPPCDTGSIPANEVCVVQKLRTLHGAEWTYYVTHGNGSFTGLTELGAVHLIDQRLATGLLNGYSIAIVTYRQTSQEPAQFRIIALPQVYGFTGRRSFFIGTAGVIHAADKQGRPADENDPPIDQWHGEL